MSDEAAILTGALVRRTSYGEPVWIQRNPRGLEARTSRTSISGHVAELIANSQPGGAGTKRRCRAFTRARARARYRSRLSSTGTASGAGAVDSDCNPRAPILEPAAELPAKG